jgi:hypothetical protein
LGASRKSKNPKEPIIDAADPPLLRKIILTAFAVLGIGFILVNIPATIMLSYSVSTLEISSQQVVAEISSGILFILASIALIILGLLFVAGAIQYYEGNMSRGVIFLGALMVSFYFLCLAVGSALLTQKTTLDTLLTLVASILIVVSVTLYLMPSFNLKIGGAALGILGGTILVKVINNASVLKIAFGWNVPFTGPFMSMVLLESIVVILGPIAAFVHVFFSDHSEGKSLTQIFLSLIALIYGVGLFIGSFVLSLSFWNWIWKSPWIGPFHGMPNWIVSTVVFWSASLFLISIGGLILILSSFLGFIFIAREFL